MIPPEKGVNEQWSVLLRIKDASADVIEHFFAIPRRSPYVGEAFSCMPSVRASGSERPVEENGFQIRYSHTDVTNLTAGATGSMATPISTERLVMVSAPGRQLIKVLFLRLAG